MGDHSKKYFDKMKALSDLAGVATRLVFLVVALIYLYSQLGVSPNFKTNTMTFLYISGRYSLIILFAALAITLLFRTVDFLLSYIAENYLKDIDSISVFKRIKTAILVSIIFYMVSTSVVYVTALTMRNFIKG